MTEETKKPADNNKRKIFAFLILVLVILSGAAAVYFYLGYKSVHISTDDAYVEGRKHTIASKVEGTVRAIHVRDNQMVKEGEILVEIDAADYDVRVSEANAVLSAERSRRNEVMSAREVAEKQLLEIKARIEVAKAGLDLQKANLRQAESDFRRAESLLKNGAISSERYEKIRTGHDVAVLQVRAAKEQMRQADALLDTQKSVIKQTETTLQSQSALVKHKEAILKKAELNRGYTKILSPADGFITKKTVEAGNQIREGLPLMAIVALDDIWITANYKETQLEKIRPGQKVEIKVDTYPGRKFMGRVESIMAGTGAVFSLFPPENATGSYVKVVQRIPVKIALDRDEDREHVLRVGMSVMATVIIEDSRGQGTKGSGEMQEKTKTSNP